MEKEVRVAPSPLYIAWFGFRKNMKTSSNTYAGDIL